MSAPSPVGATLAATLSRIERAAGSLATASVARMDETLPWFRSLPAEQRSWVMLVAQAGVQSLVRWLRGGGNAGNAGRQQISDDIFDAAPRALARAITLQQTVALIEVTIEVVEEHVPHLAAPGEQEALQEAVLRFSREVAFAAARVYARAAESRGAWDARLQALLVDALLRGDSSDVLASRAAALGWADAPPVAVAVGRSPGGEVTGGAARGLSGRTPDQRGGDRRGARGPARGGDRRCRRPVGGGGAAAERVGEGPVVVGPPVPTLDEATESARAALAGFRAAAAWPDAPRPVAAADLLPERLLAGDAEARRRLRQEVYGTLLRAGGELLTTLDTFFAVGGVLESAARALYVHPNTVRYRLRRVADVTGFTPTDPRDALTLRLALAVGRLDPPPPTGG